jgi:hypothetical protein
MGLAAAALPVCLAACSDHWFRITEVSASSSESSILHVGVDGCAAKRARRHGPISLSGIAKDDLFFVGL